MQSCDTPLTQQVFAAGLFDATASSNLAASFGQIKIRLEVRSASPEQYDGDFNTEKEWHQHMPTPWDVMQLNPAQALTISCQSCGVQIAPSELRDTYGRSFVIKDLAKIDNDCSTLFPQDSKMVHLPRMASIFEEPGFVTPNAPQHQVSAQREFHATQDWQALPRHILHNRRIESAAEVLARAAREASVRESTHDLKVLDRAPAKAITDSLQQSKRQFLRLGDHSVFYICFSTASGCGRLPSPTMFPASLVMFAFGTNTLPPSDADNAYASE